MQFSLTFTEKHAFDLQAIEVGCSEFLYKTFERFAVQLYDRADGKTRYLRASFELAKIYQQGYIARGRR